MTKAQAKRIVELYHEGWGAKSISRMLELSEQSVENVLIGKNHRDVTGGRIMKGKRPGRKLAIYREHTQS